MLPLQNKKKSEIYYQFLGEICYEANLTPLFFLVCWIDGKIQNNNLTELLYSSYDTLVKVHFYRILFF